MATKLLTIHFLFSLSNMDENGLIQRINEKWIPSDTVCNDAGSLKPFGLESVYSLFFLNLIVVMICLLIVAVELLIVRYHPSTKVLKNK